MSQKAVEACTTPVAPFSKRKPPYNRITDYLSYRILDISSLKEAAKRWAPEDVLLGVPSKKLLHQAKEDILESIEEAKYYRENLFAK